MSSNFILTANPGHDAIELLQAALADTKTSQPALFLEFSDIGKCRVMIDAWRDQIAKTGQSPVTLIFDMTKLEALGSWDRSLSEVFSERVFGAGEAIPKSWSVVFVIPASELDQLPGCIDLATLISGADGDLTKIVEGDSKKRPSKPGPDSFDTPGI